MKGQKTYFISLIPAMGAFGLANFEVGSIRRHPVLHHGPTVQTGAN
jgi:hypothetical protein